MNEAIYQKAFDLKQEGRFEESIAELKKILSTNSDSLSACHMLIAIIYYVELNDHESALPFARKSVVKRPLSEMASINLSHCLFEANLKEEMEEEIRRYVSSGAKIDLYETLFEENGLGISDFT